MFGLAIFYFLLHRGQYVFLFFEKKKHVISNF